tara:strand:- start:169 stop:435 length:267 start_codon:yes stop_codon:yes gene_type:complete
LEGGKGTRRKSPGDGQFEARKFPVLPAGNNGDSPSKTRQIVAETTGLHPRQWDRLSAVKKEVDKGNEVAIETMKKLDSFTTCRNAVLP